MKTFFLIMALLPVPLLAIEIDMHEAEYRTVHVTATNQSELGLSDIFRVSNIAEQDFVCVYIDFPKSTLSQVGEANLKILNSDGSPFLIAPLHVYDQPVVTFLLDRGRWANASLEVHFPGSLVPDRDVRDICLTIDIPSYRTIPREEYVPFDVGRNKPTHYRSRCITGIAILSLLLFVSVGSNFWMMKKMHNHQSQPITGKAGSS